MRLSFFSSGMCALAVALVACGGGGGGTSTSNVAAPVAPVVVLPPLKVFSTSYDNFMNYAMGHEKLPINPVDGSALGWADFKRNGTTQLFQAEIRYNYNIPSTLSNMAPLKFYTRDASGNYTAEADMVANDVSCLHASKAVIADFNQDGRPDVFIACTGMDKDPFPGEASVILLSQPSGKYLATKLPFIAYAHGAAAADLNGDGWPDLILTDTSVEQRPFVLINNKDGTFTRRFDLLPADMQWKLIYTVEILDVDGDGKLDILFGGHDGIAGAAPQSQVAPFVLVGNGSMDFSQARRIQLPGVPNEGKSTAFLKSGTNLYVLRGSLGDGTYDRSVTIQKVDLLTLTSSVLFTTRKPFMPTRPQNGGLAGWNGFGNGGLGFPFATHIVLYNGRIMEPSDAYDFAVVP